MFSIQFFSFKETLSSLSSQSSALMVRFWTWSSSNELLWAQSSALFTQLWPLCVFLLFPLDAIFTLEIFYLSDLQFWAQCDESIAYIIRCHLYGNQCNERLNYLFNYYWSVYSFKSSWADALSIQRIHRAHSTQYLVISSNHKKNVPNWKNSQ